MSILSLVRKALSVSLLTLVKLWVSLLKNRPQADFIQEIFELATNQVVKVSLPDGEISFYFTGVIPYWRAKTFFEKEPETIDWLDTIPDNATLWDIGANVGLYSIYAAKVRQCEVVAFEPSVFNLDLLAKNIALNNLSEQITIFPISLSSESKFALFNMSMVLPGGGRFYLWRKLRARRASA